MSPAEVAETAFSAEQDGVVGMKRRRNDSTATSGSAGAATRPPRKKRADDAARSATLAETSEVSPISGPQFGSAGSAAQTSQGVVVLHPQPTTSTDSSRAVERARAQEFAPRPSLQIVRPRLVQPSEALAQLGPMTPEQLAYIEQLSNDNSALRSETRDLTRRLREAEERVAIGEQVGGLAKQQQSLMTKMEDFLRRAEGSAAPSPSSLVYSTPAHRALGLAAQGLPPSPAVPKSPATATQPTRPRLSLALPEDVTVEVPTFKEPTQPSPSPRTSTPGSAGPGSASPQVPRGLPAPPFNTSGLGRASSSARTPIDASASAPPARPLPSPLALPGGSVRSTGLGGAHPNVVAGVQALLNAPKRQQAPAMERTTSTPVPPNSAAAAFGFLQLPGDLGGSGMRRSLSEGGPLGGTSSAGPMSLPDPMDIDLPPRAWSPMMDQIIFGDLPQQEAVDEEPAPDGSGSEEDGEGEEDEDEDPDAEEDQEEDEGDDEDEEEEAPPPKKRPTKSAGKAPKGKAAATPRASGSRTSSRKPKATKAPVPELVTGSGSGSGPAKKKVAARRR